MLLIVIRPVSVTIISVQSLGSLILDNDTGCFNTGLEVLFDGSYYWYWMLRDMSCGSVCDYDWINASTILYVSITIQYFK